MLLEFLFNYNTEFALNSAFCADFLFLDIRRLPHKLHTDGHPPQISTEESELTCEYAHCVDGDRPKKCHDKDINDGP